MMAQYGKFIVLVGLVIVGTGVVMMFFDKIPFLGKLPGDINIRKENFQLYVPITTSVLLSVVVSLVLWLLSYLTRK
jgi:hypothetical protein